MAVGWCGGGGGGRGLGWLLHRACDVGGQEAAAGRGAGGKLCGGDVCHMRVSVSCVKDKCTLIRRAAASIIVVNDQQATRRHNGYGGKHRWEGWYVTLVAHALPFHFIRIYIDGSFIGPLLVPLDLT